MMQESIIKLCNLSIFNDKIGKRTSIGKNIGSVWDLYEKARKVDVGITLDMVFAWMRAQPNKQTRNYKNYNTALFPKYESQIDLMDVTSLLRDVGSEIKSQLRYGLYRLHRYIQQKMSHSPYPE